METALIQIRKQQQTWDKFSPGWKKWDTWAMNFLRPMGEAIIETPRIQDTDEVLDVATGTGEPGLTIARLASRGHAIGLDLSEGMLATARDNAARQGIANYAAVAGDAGELPFAAVSCRMSFMFFPDMLLAAQEMHRVLKPGGWPARHQRVGGPSPKPLNKHHDGHHRRADKPAGPDPAGPRHISLRSAWPTGQLAATRGLPKREREMV